jgi:hypothetical protein
VWRTEPYPVRRGEQIRSITGQFAVWCPAAGLRAGTGFFFSSWISPSRSTICTDCSYGVCGWNLGESVIGSHQLPPRVGSLYSNPTAGISLSGSGFFMLTTKSAILLSFASCDTATLMTEAVASITVPGAGVALILQHAPRACQCPPLLRWPG